MMCYSSFAHANITKDIIRGINDSLVKAIESKSLVYRLESERDCVFIERCLIFYAFGRDSNNRTGREVSEAVQ